MSSDSPLLHLQNVTRRFGAFTALHNVDVEARRGEILGLLGENGAGKSTLMNIIGGTLTPTSGKLLWQGEEVHFTSARDATLRDIGVVQQHFGLVPVFTVAENIALHCGNQAKDGALVNLRQWQTRVEEWAKQLGWKIEGGARIDSLSVGECQRVEILKALYGSGGPTSLLLLDEPTANLTPAETAELFPILRRLRDDGCAVVFVSHKLNEVMELCDRVTVLRRGKVVGERAIEQTDVHDLATLMVGREIENNKRSPTLIKNTQDCLEINNLSGGVLKEVTLQVRAGEIVGLAGVDGNGQRDLVELLCGWQSPTSGTFSIQPQDRDSSRPLIGLIPPDRQREGLILTFDLAENMALHPTMRRSCSQHFSFDWTKARAHTRELMQQFDVRTPVARERSAARNLSGGNQQKVVIARALSFGPSLVIAVDPTRGLDIGAATFVHQQLQKAADEDAAVLLLSTDLDEVVALSHRIGVLYEGRLLPDSQLLPSGTSRETVGALMGGSIAHLAQQGGDKIC